MFSGLFCVYFLSFFPYLQIMGKPEIYYHYSKYVTSSINELLFSCTFTDTIVDIQVRSKGG